LYAPSGYGEKNDALNETKMANKRGEKLERNNNSPILRETERREMFECSAPPRTTNQVGQTAVSISDKKRIPENQKPVPRRRHGFL
jgi:hypothetical protein